jgi:hypothetical protein
MRSLAAGLAVLLVAGCGADKAPPVKAEPAGPDHLLAVQGSDLGDGWRTTSPGADRTCLSRYAAGLGGGVETVSLGDASATLLEEIRTVPGLDADRQGDKIQAQCPRETGTPALTDGTRYGMDPVVRGNGTTWSLWQPTETGVVVLTGEGISVAKAYAALGRRHTAWQRDRLAKAQALWRANGPASYTMTQSWGCFCPSGDYRVTVVDGKVTHAVSEKGEDTPRRGATVDQLYERLSKQEMGTYTLRYDDDLGYPTSINSDPIVNAIDDEYGVRITDLKAS